MEWECSPIPLFSPILIPSTLPSALPAANYPRLPPLPLPCPPSQSPPILQVEFLICIRSKSLCSGNPLLQPELPPHSHSVTVGLLLPFTARAPGCIPPAQHKEQVPAADAKRDPSAAPCRAEPMSGPGMPCQTSCIRCLLCSCLAPRPAPGTAIHDSQVLAGPIAPSGFR